MKKTFLLIICLCVFKLKADTPGKQKMNSSKVTLRNINKLTGYDFYWQLKNDSAMSIMADTTLVIPSSGGAPYNAAFWGINRVTKVSTDTLSFENYYAPDYVVTIDSISNDNFRYTKSEMRNEIAGGVLGNDYPKKNSRSEIILFSAISFTALILLIWLFIRRKNAAGKA